MHNTSKSKIYKNKFWKIVYFKNYKTKSRAMKEEYKLKKNYILRNVFKIYNENINFSSL